jgi:hypothetical protein
MILGAAFELRGYFYFIVYFGLAGFYASARKFNSSYGIKEHRTKAKRLKYGD